MHDLLARKEIVLALFAPDEGEDNYNDDDYYGGDYTDDDYYDVDYTDDDYYDDDYDHQVDHDQKDNCDGSGDYRIVGIFCF